MARTKAETDAEQIVRILKIETNAASRVLDEARVTFNAMNLAYMRAENALDALKRQRAGSKARTRRESDGKRD